MGRAATDRARVRPAGYSLLFGVERARKRLAWTRDVETGILRFIGVAEILGAVGVLLPAATGPYLALGPRGRRAGDHHGARDRFPFVFGASGQISCSTSCWGSSQPPSCTAAW
ncbi:MAG TPA: DoxX family protein [Candidatus Limnocylindria bacterium]|nr:DoxX family protein [Candidatus Limnocylindria bacterium]